MSIWGKIIGGVAGFAVGGPLGAVVGAAAGHAVDRLREDAEEEPPRRLGRTGGGFGAGDSRAAKQMSFSVAVIVLGAKMAKADGAVCRAEVDAFKRVFRIPPSEAANVGRIFDAARRDAGGFEPYARQVAFLFRDEPVVLEDLLAGLFHIARADGPIGPSELGFLRKVAGIFDLDAAAFARAQTGGTAGGEADGPDPYQILGIGRGASDDEIKQTYRRLVRENHPDTLIAKGMPADFVAVANDKLAVINAAFDRIAKERHLK